MRGKFLDNYSNLVPPPPRGNLADTPRPRRAYTRADERAIGYVPYQKGELPDPLPARLIAFYLPQFHTIPENDQWWGKGFTEWRNVTRALPQFEGHYQPKLPGDLGFYDLSNPEVLREQTRLAREYGISAFCSYFYWFDGKTLLEKPLRNWLEDPTIDFPICLCWANENWSRRWDGRSDDILIAQKHSAEDDLAFIRYIADYLKDPRYLRVDGKPMLLVYRPGLLPDAKATAERWRHWCLQNGIGEIHLTYVQSFERPDPRDIGFDAAVEFPPNLSNPSSLAATQSLINPEYQGEVLDWRELVEDCLSRERPDYLLYRGVNPGWDNEARRPSKGRTYLHSSPRRYRDWLKKTIEQECIETPGSQPLVFINAWNEWAEGAVLEPAASLGYACLEETRQAMLPPPVSTIEASPLCHAWIHAWFLPEFNEILAALCDSDVKWQVIVTTTSDKEGEVRTALVNSGISHEVILTENRGRDILPFLRLLGNRSLQSANPVLKLHTKRSRHRDDGDAWRRELLESLLADGHALRIFEAFEKDPHLGLVAPAGHLLPLPLFLGGNRENLASLASQLGLAESFDLAQFVAGSMFWVRPSALHPLMDGLLHPSDFEAESAQIDGTMAHALERLFCVIIESNDFTVTSVSTLCHEAEPDISNYRFTT